MDCVGRFFVHLLSALQGQKFVIYYYYYIIIFIIIVDDINNLFFILNQLSSLVVATWSSHSLTGVVLCSWF